MRQATDGLARHGCALALAMMAASSALGDYQPGYTWHRATDWVPGVMQDSTENNPGPDSEGNPAWSYEWSSGGGLASENAWYAQPTTMMIWDDLWFETGLSLWSKGDEISPLVQPRRLVHNVLEEPFPYTPLARWLNPAGNGTHVDIYGTLTVLWDGPDGLGSEDPIDVVIAFENALNRSITPLFSETVAKPTAGDSILESLQIPIALPDIEFNAGDSLIVSLRSHESFSPYGRWNALYDDLTLTLVPAPASLGVLAMGTLAASRRRRAA